MDSPKRPSMTKAELMERLAAALAQLWEIPHGHRKQMTAEQVVSLGQCDHNIPHAIGGPHRHWNYYWRLILDHRQKTAEVDIPQIAKTDRITESQAEFQRKMLAKTGQDEPQPEIKKKPKAKIQSRGFQKRPEGQKHNWGSRKLSGRKTGT